MSALLDRDVPLVTLSGKAGTGKTLLSLAASLETKRYYRQIFLARPIVPLSNKDIGYLPGDINSKLIFTGDVYQIDHPYLDSQSNGLSYLIEKMKGQKLYAHINLEKGERSELSDLAIQLL